MSHMTNWEFFWTIVLGIMGLAFITQPWWVPEDKWIDKDGVDRK